MYNSGYPAARFSLFDNSGASSDVLFSPPTDGLCVPFAFVMAERGVPGAIYYGGAKELTPLLGSATFDPASPYFNSSNLMIGKAMAAAGVEVMRLVDPAATASTIGLFVAVTATNVTQYKKDASGARLLDASGNPIPRLAADGVTQVTEPGVVVRWFVRKLVGAETADTLTVLTTTTGGITTKTYPVMAGTMSWPGKAGDRQGFSLYSIANTDSSIAQSLNSVLYRFVPVALATGVSVTAGVIPDSYGSLFNDVSFKDSAIYASTNTNYAFNYVLGNAYVDRDTDQNLLPYDLHVYGENVGLVGKQIVTASPELGSLDPYMVDLISGTDLDGNYYDHFHVDASSAEVVNSSAVNYALGGSDGDTSWAMFDSLVADWLSGSDHGEFTNLQQHPMTHFSDPGFSMTTKMLLLNMLDLRDNFKVDLSTQDISKAPNTKAQDISAGQALMFRAQMHPESVINGVGCTRVGVYAHTAKLIDGSPYGTIMPFTLNRLMQRVLNDGGTYIKGSAGGDPNSRVTLFHKPNWVADDVSSQALSWANCLNVVRHASRTILFYPAYRTVYPNDTSLLVDDEVSDRILYIYKICRRNWAKWVGKRMAPKKLYPLLQADIQNDCNAAFSGDNIKVKPTVYQTAVDSNLGFQVSVNIAVTGDPTLRVDNFNVVVGRSSGS